MIFEEKQISSQLIYEGKILEERRTEDFSKKELGYYMLGGAKGHE